MYKRLRQIQPPRFNPAAIIAFLRYFGYCVTSVQSLQIATALAYTTLLSLVPLVAVMVSFLNALPVFSQFEQVIREFVVGNFVPAFGDTIDEYLNQFTGKAKQLTLTGVAFLVVIALMLMATIENAFNRIWKVGEKRRPLVRFLIYWLLLTLGPILVGAGIASTSYLLSLSAVDTLGMGFDLQKRLLSLLPFLTTSVALTLLYMLVPNCYVPLRYAITGGVCAAVLFETAKFGFGYYVKTVPTYEAIYGALAVLPIFLIWIYVSWIVVLLGAQLTYSLSTFRMTDTDSQPEREWDLVDVCLVLAHMWHAQREGHGLSLEQLGALEPALAVEHIIQILDELQNENWVFEKEDEGEWILTRDLSEQNLLDLYYLMPGRLPDGTASRIPRSSTERSLQMIFNRYRNSVQEILSVPIKPLLLDPDPDSIPDADKRPVKTAVDTR